MLAEVLCIFNITTFILWQTMVARFSIKPRINKFATLDNSKKRVMPIYYILTGCLN